MLASATEIVCALGAGEMLVGRSHECDDPAWVRSLPACSEPAFDVSVSSGAIDAEVRRRVAAGEELYRIDGDRIRSLQPDLLLAQSHCEVCAVTPDDVGRAGATVPMLALSAFSIEDIFESIGQVAEKLGLADRGTALVERERARLQNVRTRTTGMRKPTAVMLEWADPLFAMGNWGPELLEITGGDLRIGKKGEYSSTVAPEQLVEADPEFLIVAPCGFGLERSLAEREVLERNAWWPRLRAVREGNVAFADGNRFFNRSGMTVTQTAEIIAEILHGITFQESTRGLHWKWIGDMA